MSMLECQPMCTSFVRGMENVRTCKRQEPVSADWDGRLAIIFVGCPSSTLESL
jgi:hypothetical protein